MRTTQSVYFVVVLVLVCGCAVNDNAVVKPKPLRSAVRSELSLGSIFALDKDTAWAGGVFYNHAATLVSAMFATNDGGKTWKRMGPGIGNSTIFSIFFQNEKRGWAAGAWTTESAGSPFVLRTSDGGKTWRRSNIPVETARKSPLFVPCTLEFTSAKHGVLILEGTIVEDESAVFITSNGGVTWTFSHGRASLTCGLNQLAVPKDGCLWKIENSQIFVSSDTGLHWRKTKSQPHQRSEKEK